MRAGQLRDRVTLQSPPAPDAEGQRGSAYTDVDRVWADVQVISTRELFQAGAAQSLVTRRVTIRHRTDIATGWRVVLGDGTTCAVATPPRDPGGRKRWLELDVEEVA